MASAVPPSPVSPIPTVEDLIFAAGLAARTRVGPDRNAEVEGPLVDEAQVMTEALGALQDGSERRAAALVLRNDAKRIASGGREAGEPDPASTDPPFHAPAAVLAPAAPERSFSEMRLRNS